ncbi:hypothetical protein HYC85_025254 [Camellia sinensis]|uniref:Uncharacterized protein n=1 Tax=Camellia sinensis TaxID=4442 RepID=A0A7J7GE87_CAMSI|nr:hypothetical protein HYC85_025254 [Camellia sinensis]
MELSCRSKNYHENQSKPKADLRALAIDRNEPTSQDQTILDFVSEICYDCIHPRTQICDQPLSKFSVTARLITKHVVGLGLGEGVMKIVSTNYFCWLQSKDLHCRLVCTVEQQNRRAFP